MATIGIFTTDKDLKITTWDEWLEVATGIKKSEAKDKPLEAIVPDLEERNIKKRFLNVLENGVVEVLSPVFHHNIIDCRPLKPSNLFEKMQQRVTIAPLKEDETIVGTIVTIEDLTEKMERERQFSEKLKSQNEAERLSAAQFFVQEKKVEDKGIFKDILKDESWRVRKVAVDALKSKTDLDTVATLLKSLKEEHNNINILNSALQILTMSEIDVTDTLVNFLMSDDRELRQYAALALGEIKDKKAIPYLLKALNDDDINVRYHVIEALGKMKAKEAVRPILEILETRDFFLAFPAIDALANIGDERAAAKLIGLLDDELLSGPAIDAMAVLGSEDTVPYLVRALDHVNVNMVVSILKAIVSIYEHYNEKYGAGDIIADIVKNRISRTGADKIVKSLDGASDESLHIIALILGWLEGDVIDKALTGILGKTSARKEIIDSIVTHGQHIVNLLIDQVYSKDMEIKKSAIIALGRIGDKRAVSALISVLDEEPELAIISAGALAKIGDRSAFEALLNHIADRDVGVRQAVISALNSIGHPDMADKMLLFLKDKDPIVRESAVKIAGYFGYAECIDLLIERCTDEVENVRYAVIQCLPFLEDKRVLSIIVNALKKDTPKVRAAAAYALGQL
ncbi:MAG TPA: HEAT repeat domain-containing protein, partial [Syntrophorhabdaceae bacterium]|nr:HEAT repeat domain-containing protein [Syntrophorhabdaceae bacterium]